MQREQVLHHVRRLSALVDREPPVALVPIRYQASCLECHPRVARKPELGGDDLIRRRQRRIHLPGVDPAFPRQISTQFRMQQRRYGIECLFDVDQRRQGCILDVNLFQRVFRDGAALGYHHHDGLALPSDAADCERVLRR